MNKENGIVKRPERRMNKKELKEVNREERREMRKVKREERIEKS